MKVASIAECSHWSILQYFWPALSDNLSWKQVFVFLRVIVLGRFFCKQTICYNSFLVYCRELAPVTVSLTGDQAQGDDSKHDSLYKNIF